MQFQKNVLLKNYTTFQIGGPAKYFFIAKTRKDLIEALGVAKKNNLPFFILGGGSNLLVSDRGYEGLVIKMQNAKCKMQNDNSKFKIFCDAGLSLSKLVSLSLKIGVTGLEWGVGIPGTVGGAIRGNAGAFGGEMKDVIESVEVLDIEKNKILKNKNLARSKNLDSFGIKDCKFGYRDSIFKQNPNLIILSAELKLKKPTVHTQGNRQKIKKEIQNHLNYRKERHPQQPSAGSVFKNIELKKLPRNFFKKFPEAERVMKKNILPTAFLINQCGLKGEKNGGTQISEIHPNFIVNLGRAKAKDVLKLINLVKKKIKERFGILLEEEIQHLGF